MSGYQSETKLPQRAAVHLDDAQFSDLLAGDSLDSVGEAHLRTCAACQAEVELLTGSLVQFNTLSMAWAEREAPRRVPVPSRWQLRFGGRPVWGAGLAVAAASMALAFGLQLPQHQAPETPLASSAQREAVAPSRSDLAADNQLLASIDQELNSPTQPSVSLADLKAPGSHASSESYEGAVAN